MFSLIRKNSFSVFLLLGAMTCGCTAPCCYQDSVEIPSHWHTHLESKESLEIRGLWWESFDDSLLITLIDNAICNNSDIHLIKAQSKEKLLETINFVSAEIAKNYIELRGFQQRFKTIQESLEAQKNQMISQKNLLSQGLISSIDLNERKKNLESLLLQQSFLELSIKKSIFHISTLAGYPPESLFDILTPIKELPAYTSLIFIETPCALIQRHPAIQETKKVYQKTKSKMAFYHYKKQVLNVLEKVENALASVVYSLDKISNLDRTKRVRFESYESIYDLYNQGIKDEREVVEAYQDLLNAEIAFIEGQTELLINYINLQESLAFVDCF